MKAKPGSFQRIVVVDQSLALASASLGKTMEGLIYVSIFTFRVVHFRNRR